MEIMAITFYYNKIKIQIFKIFSGTIEETVQMHSHSKGGYEIHLIDYGHGTLDTADESYIITPNTLYVTGPNVLHKQTPDSNSPMHELCVFFKIPNQTYNNEAITAFASNTFWIGESSDEIQDLFSQMIKENENGGLYKYDVLSSLAIRLICEISKLYCPNKEKRTTDFESSDLNENRSWILDQLLLDDCSNVRLDDFAKKMGVSPRQAERIIKDYYDTSFKKLRYESKMAMAATMLERKKFSVEECAIRCGYSCASAFITAFKKKYGLTPKEYSKQFSETTSKQSIK